MKIIAEVGLNHCGNKMIKYYNSDIWDISRSALEGSPGIYTHVSFRKDKSDCQPQEELQEILKRF